MKILELYAGDRSIGKVGKRRGHNVFSVDWFNYDEIDLVVDIEFLEANMIPIIPDMVWIGTDCTTYTIAAISTHRNGQIPKTEYAAKCDRTNIHVISLVKYWQNINPNMIFYFENPRGYLRKMDFMKQFDRTTITYCSYGDDRMKPTDIWSNNIYNMFNLNGWKPRPICYNNNKKCHHEAAPRGSKTGTQGRKNAHERSKMPEALCEEIITNAESIFLS